MEYAIETTDLTKKYGALTAVDKLNLRVKANTIHGFLGPNGAGKTTTIKVLVGLLKPDGGSVSVLGQKVDGDRPDVRLRMGYMPELPKFPKHLKGKELLDIYGRMYGMAEQKRKEQIPKLLEMVRLEGRGNDLIGKYSKGMQQRLGMAQALLAEPELVILDEPSIGLDPVGMIEVRDMVKGILKEGVTVFFSSHLLHEVEQVCGYATIINRGVAVVSGTLEEISNQLAGPVAIRVEVDRFSDTILKEVRKLPFVTDVSKEGKNLILKLNTQDDVRPLVSRAITKAGGVIISMSLTGHSLEDAFMQIVTRGQVSGTAI